MPPKKSKSVPARKPVPKKLKSVTARKRSSVPVDMAGPAAKFVKDSIAKDTVVIFSKTYCPYCTMAKEVFQKLKKSFTAIELDKRDDGDQIQGVLGEMTGAKTVPRVFINGECVGGGTDVKALYESGKLEKML
ncbi:Glutaredoxin [Nesidiocoris tenuis]|uniref:Glutaredoxin n=1 Tax=Nesidiocoris tenuis TaxID=355587 RepID=A0ABN7AI08_9HEMI|nr:Glutaredoxin [Nesidiocoris tenuis]